MAIRFPCPACRQPIEVDDEWGNQSVGCPFCQKVVTAPASSSWRDDDIPVATPAGSAFGQAPPPPANMSPDGMQRPYGTAPQRGGLAPKALALSLSSVALAIIGWVAFFGIMLGMLEGRLTADPTPEEFRQVQKELMDDMMETGQLPRSSVGTFATILGTCCGFAGLALGAKSLIRQERRRGMAITACVISTFFLCCQMPLGMIACQSTPSPRLPPPSSAPTSSPAETEEEMEANRVVMAECPGHLSWQMGDT